MLLPITTSVSQILEPIRENSIYFHIMAAWIAPHGATDVIDAVQNKKVPKMLSCYLGAVGFGELCSVFDADAILYGLFTLASFYHFREDFSFFDKRFFNGSSYVINGALFYSFYQYSWLPFFLYMTCLHVPHHYYNHWSLMKNNTIPTLGLIAATAVGSSMVLLQPMSRVVENSIVAIVIGHVLYLWKEK